VAQAKVIDGRPSLPRSADDVAEAEAAPQREEPDPRPRHSSRRERSSSKLYVRGKGRACVGAGLGVELACRPRFGRSTIAEVESSWR